MDGLGSTLSGEHPPVSAIAGARAIALHHALLIGRFIATDIAPWHPKISREFGRPSLGASVGAFLYASSLLNGMRFIGHFRKRAFFFYQRPIGATS
jgi:hypothetical protein